MVLDAHQLSLNQNKFVKMCKTTVAKAHQHPVDPLLLLKTIYDAFPACVLQVMVDVKLNIVSPPRCLQLCKMNSGVCTWVKAS